MGIQGLLPFLKDYAKKSSIKEFKGKSVGVDASVWMHKGAFSCSLELVTGQDTDKFVYFFVKWCELLRYHKVKPVIVFDGAKLPAKAKEESRRLEARESARLEAIDLVEKRKKGQQIDDRRLQSLCQTAIRITSAMISRLMGALRELQISFIVAPFEADAQLAYMCRKGWVDAVITEDGDLLAYGCPNTIFKMDKDGEIAQHLVLPGLQPPAKGAPAPAPAEDIEMSVPEDDGNAKSKGSKAKRGRKKGEDAEAPSKEFPPLSCMNKWSAEKFAAFCVLCGSDYKEPDVHIKGLGIKYAFKFMCNFATPKDMVSWMSEDNRWKDKLPCSVDEYIDRFNQICAVFWHHIVFNPQRGTHVSIAEAFPSSQHLRALPNLNLKAICGTPAPSEEAKLMANGKLDPRTKKQWVHEPLTPSERATLDRILSQKRADQRDFQFNQSLREETARAREAYEARTAEPVPEPSAPAPQSSPPAAQEEPEPEPPEPETPAKLPIFLPHDLSALAALKASLYKENIDPNAGEPEQQQQAITTANPFARKRVGAVEVNLPKRQRINEEDAQALDSQSSGIKKSGSAVSSSQGGSGPTGSGEKVLRQMVPAEAHSRGGFAAKDAAHALLAQRGIPLLIEDKDKGKLTAFFKVTKSVEPEAPKPQEPPRSGLATWKARPWEVEEVEVDPFNVGTNLLSLSAQRGRNPWRSK